MAPYIMFAVVMVAMMFVTQSDAACDEMNCPVLDCVDPGTNPYDPCCQRCPNGKCGVYTDVKWALRRLKSPSTR